MEQSEHKFLSEFTPHSEFIQENTLLSEGFNSHL